MSAISSMHPSSGRFLKEDDGQINLANITESFHDVNTVVTEGVDGRYLRAGKYFESGYIWSEVADEGVSELHLKTGSKPVLMAYRVAATALSEYGLYLSPTVTGDGTELNVFCKNQVTPQANTATVYRDPTYSGIGAIQVPRFIGSGSNIISRSGGDNLEQVSMLEANSSYLVAATNASGAAQDRIGIWISWLELEV